MRVAFHTFGCKLNQYETEALADPFRCGGHSIVDIHEDAELYIINTCTVTARADHKARALVRSVSRRSPSAFIVVTGCGAELEAGAFAGLGPNVIVVSQTEKPRLLALPEKLSRLGKDGHSPVLPDVRTLLPEGARAAGAPDPFLYEAKSFSFHTRAFLKIQDGCDARCAYCRVPLARGKSVSLEAVKALERMRELAERGYGEIVLTGVNISAYRSSGLDLAGLLQAMAGEAGNARLRLSSLEPDAVNEKLLSALRHPGICAHFHLAVQSGSDAVLARMRRRYAAHDVAEAVAALRRVKEDPFLAADIITGFPGETEADFQATMELARSLGFSALHVFPFSPRRGTDAAELGGQIPHRERTGRAGELMSVSRAFAAAYRSRWIGKEVEALIEERSGGSAGLPCGTTSNYLKVMVGGAPGGNHKGKLVRARILSSDNDSGNGMCQGEFLEFLH